MRAAAFLAAAVCLFASPLLAGPSVYSLDQCADQYVLALSPRQNIVALSTRARNADSYLRAQAMGLPERRATLESVLAADPAVVVRYWGGDDRLLADLRRRGIRVLTIDDAGDFAGVAGDIRRIAAGLDAGPAGERLVKRMETELSDAANAGRGRGAYYLTSGGDTAGGGVLVDAMIRAAGFSNLNARPRYGGVSLERLLMSPPKLFVLGFFDQDMAVGERWSVGRNQALRRQIAGRASISLPASILGCPAWFAADGAASLATWARAHRADP
jgi:iron complex transport system substrate-binding protein